jgi:hypothetical protein
LEQLLQGMATVGHRIADMEQLFSSIPVSFQKLINDTLQALALLAAARAGPKQKKSRLLESVTQSQEVSPFSHPENVQIGDHYDDVGVGYHCISFDLHTGKRLKLECNNTMAKIFGMHSEEVLARAGHCDTEAPCSQFECLCLLMEEMSSNKHQARSHQTTYHRQLPVQNGRIRGDPLLIRRDLIRDHADTGGLVRIQNFVTVVSEDEYDMMMLNNPTMCRPMSFALGDIRLAAEVLSTAHRDFL